MAEQVPLIGEQICEAFSWVTNNKPIYLVMDNAGGHSTAGCIDEYVDLLKDKYNVIVRHQEPRSPETNLLDLGVWCSLQSWVDKAH